MSDPKNDAEKLMATMLASLRDEKMAGLNLDDLKDAMSHPQAAEAVTGFMSIEAASVQEGQPAPDFRLPYLPGNGTEGASVTLSDHFGKRPVALIFGSYT